MQYLLSDFYILVGVVSLDLGNIGSWESLLEEFGVEYQIVDNGALSLSIFDTLILPGVGSYDVAVRNLDEKGFREPILDWAQKGGNLIGVCLGMQLLLSESEEGHGNGLGIIPGKVLSFKGRINDKFLRMGWGPVKFCDSGKIIDRLYFAHGFYCKPSDERDVYATSYYGLEYAAAVKRDNVYGFQFHPEKSGPRGLALLKELLS